MASGLMRVPRSRGAISGLLVLLLGAWGALVPFVGPYLSFAYTPDTTWTATTGRWVLEVLPGAAAFVGGFILLTSANRAAGLFGGWLAALAGAWFVLGPVVSRLWVPAGDLAGQPVGGPRHQVAEQLGFFTGLGVLILFLAATALGRFAVRGVRDAELAEAEAVEREAAERERAALAGTQHEPTRRTATSGPRRDGLDDGVDPTVRSGPSATTSTGTTALPRDDGATGARPGKKRPQA